MKFTKTTFWMAALITLITGAPSFAADSKPTPTATPAEKSENSNDDPTLIIGRTEYSHSLGSTHYSKDDARAITMSAGAVSNLTFNFGVKKSGNTIYAGIGYNWLGKLEQNGAEMNQSANKILLQLGFDHQFFSIVGFAPLIGASVQYLPGFLSTHPDETTSPNEIQYEGGTGFKAYVGLAIPYGYYAHLGYQMARLQYKDGPGVTSGQDFDLYYRAVYFSAGVEF